MVVIDLQYYIENFYPQGRQKVSILELADRYRKIEYVGPTGRQKLTPVIVVDGMAVLRRIYKMDDLEWLYGGQWKHYVDNFNTFVQRFKDADIDLVFVFNGKAEDPIENDWISKQTEKLKDIQQIFRHMILFNSYPDEHLSQMPAGLDNFIRFALTRLCKVRCVLEAEREVAEYALTTPNCFAILSQNPHYLIFDTKPYLSIDHLKLGTLETMQYERQSFAQRLGLTMVQLPLFALLIGTKVLSVEALEKFHSRLTASSNGYPDIEVLIHRVAEFVCSIGWTGNLTDYAMLMILSKLSKRLEVSPEMLLMGLKFYSLAEEIEKPLASSPSCHQYSRERLIEKYRQCEMLPFIYTLLTKKSFKSCEHLEDQQTTGLMPSSLIYRPLRKRLYSLLYGSEPVEVEELLVIEGRPLLAEKVKPEPIYASGFLVSLDVLWHSHASHKHVRWQSLMKVLGFAPNKNHMQDIQPEHRGFVWVLKYLLRHPVGDPHILPWEVDALVAQAVSPIASDLNAIKDIEIVNVDPRAVHLATIVLQGVLTLLGLLQMTKEPLPLDWALPWNFFDGKLFHYFYNLAKNGASFEELLQHEKTCVKAFIQMRTLVVSGTYIIKERYHTDTPATEAVSPDAADPDAIKLF